MTVKKYTIDFDIFDDILYYDMKGLNGILVKHRIWSVFAEFLPMDSLVKIHMSCTEEDYKNVLKDIEKFKKNELFI